MIGRTEKEDFLNQRAVVIWLTGLPCSGKTTLAVKLEHELFRMGYLTKLLDGDNLRFGLNKDLGFSVQDREENIRRIAQTSTLFIACGIICINSFISPTQRIRQLAKDIIGPENFIEIYLSASQEVCEKRDVKGMYRKARAGEIKNFTGIDSIFEVPSFPDLEINTAVLSVEAAAEKCLGLILPRISKPSHPTSKT